MGAEGGGQGHLPDGLPFAFAKRYGLVVTELGSSAEVTFRPGASPLAVAEARRHLGRPLRLRQVSAHEFDRLLQLVYEQGSRQAMEMMGALDEELDLAQVARQLAEPEDLLEAEDDAPIIRLINALLTEALKANASDIHVEPFEHRLVVRFRVDGVLREVLQPNRVLAPLLVSRIKVMARLDIAEKRLPQDGRISLRIAGRPVDVRVSTLPSGYGERVVLRLLDKQAGRLDLEHLGMSSEALLVMDHLIHRPHGIILVTGPTGSGKTTTLYAGLLEVNSLEKNVMTLEDPVEYRIPVIRQSQVNPRAGFTFAMGLRALLRQDPDVILVGEIRDPETAELAVRAAMTGHLVLSTLHTNDAASALPRLIDMGVAPYLLPSTLIAIVSQRLVRRPCPHCRVPETPDPAMFASFGHDPEPGQFVRTVGCPRCGGSGFSGRLPIAEFLCMSPEVNELIMAQASAAAINEAAFREGMADIREDGYQKARQGLTTLEEVRRVAERRLMLKRPAPHSTPAPDAVPAAPG